jgi:hypothetical protein
MATPARERMRRYRQQMRARGLRPVNLWVHDTSDPRVRKEIRAEVAAIRAHDRREDTEAYVDAVLAAIGGARRHRRLEVRPGDDDLSRLWRDIDQPQVYPVS